MSFLSKNIVGLVLAGGQGSRMGGVDKGLEAYLNRPLVDHVIQALAPQTDSLLISANRNLDRYRAFGHTVVEDADQNYHGPMAGIAAGLAALTESHYEFALVSSCDTPNIPNFMAERLHSKLVSSPAKTAFVHDGQQRQNLHCLIKREAWENLILYYQDGGRAMYKWHQQIGDVAVDFSDCAVDFENFNHR